MSPCLIPDASVMSFFLATVDEASAERIGYIIGVCIGIGIVLGTLAFCVFAVVKAFTRRTTGWIVAGSIGGAVLLFFGIAFMVGVVTGFMNARQRGLHPGDISPAPSVATAAQVVQGRDIPYKVTLPPGWAAKRASNAFDLLASRRSLYFGVIAEEGSVGTPETLLNLAQNRLRKNSGELQLGETSTVRIDGRDWLRFTAKCQVEKIPFTYQYSVYTGAEGSFQLMGWTLQSLYDRDAGTLSDLAAGFRFPAAPDAATAGGAPVAVPSPAAAPQVLVGDTLAYTLTVPENWEVKHHSSGFDLEVTHRGVYIGVAAEEGSMGSPSAVLSSVQDRLRKVATDVQFSPAYAVKIDGRDWLQFTAKCQIQNLPFGYHYYVYAGPEGSFRILSWTLQNLFDRDDDTMRDVAMTFRFPPVAPQLAPTPASLVSPAKPLFPPGKGKPR